MFTNEPLQEIPLLVLTEPFGVHYEAHYFYGMTVAEMKDAGISMDDLEINHYRRMQMFGLADLAVVVRHLNIRLMFPMRSIYGVMDDAIGAMRLFFVNPHATMFMVNDHPMSLPVQRSASPCSLDAMIGAGRPRTGLNTLSHLPLRSGVA